MMLTHKMTLLLVATAANTLEFTDNSDGDCEVSPSGGLRGFGDKGTYSIPTSQYL